MARFSLMPRTFTRFTHWVSNLRMAWCSVAMLCMHAIPGCALPCPAVLCSAVSAVQCCAVLCSGCAVLCCAALCCAVLCCAVLRCAVLCCVALSELRCAVPCKCFFILIWMSVLLGSKPLEKSIRHYIRDPSSLSIL